MGMTPEQFWDGESSNYPAYRKAYQLKIENEQKLADRQNWLMGQYLMAALQATPLLVGVLCCLPPVQSFVFHFKRSWVGSALIAGLFWWSVIVLVMHGGTSFLYLNL